MTEHKLAIDYDNTIEGPPLMGLMTDEDGKVVAFGLVQQTTKGEVYLAAVPVKLVKDVTAELKTDLSAGAVRDAKLQGEPDGSNLMTYAIMAVALMLVIEIVFHLASHFAL